MQTKPKTKRKRFDFEQTKAAATSGNRAVRKQVFTEYFEQFGEFPTYFFDNERGIHPQLGETISDLLADPETPKKMREGIEQLQRRLPDDVR